MALCFNCWSKNQFTAPSLITAITGIFFSFFTPSQLKQSAIKIFKNIYHTPQCLNKIKNKEREISNILLREIKTPIQSLFDDKKLNQPGINKLKKIFSHYAEYGHYVDDPGFLFQSADSL